MIGKFILAGALASAASLAQAQEVRIGLNLPYTGVGAELAQHHLVCLGELAGRIAQQIQCADDAAFPPKRHNELGARTRHRLHVARIRVDVVDQDRVAFRHRGTHQTVAHLQPQRGRFVRIADRVGNRELLALLVEQVRGEGVKLGETGNEQRNLLQQLVEIEHGRHFASEFEQRNDELADVRGRRRRR